MDIKRLIIAMLIIAVVLTLVYINVSTPDNIAYMDETTTITTDGKINGK